MHLRNAIRPPFISLALFMAVWLAVPGQSQGVDIISQLLKDNLATDQDVADLFYFSYFNQQPQSAEVNQAKENDPALREVQLFLFSHGFQPADQVRAVSRREFARLLFDRFQLQAGFLTGLLQWDDLYYAEAQKRGIFNPAEQGNEAMSTREMLKAYLVAEQMGR